MPSTLSRSTVSTSGFGSTSTLWDPRRILQIQDDCRCVGYAPSKRRKCMIPIAGHNMVEVDSILQKMSTCQPDPEALRSKLQRLAKHALCIRYHQNQMYDMAEKWEDRITDAFPCGVVELPPRRSSTRFLSNDRVSPSIRTSTRTSMSSPERSEIEALQETIRVAQQHLDRLLLDANRAPSPTISRISTSEISSLHLSRTSTTRSISSVSSTASTTRPNVSSSAVTPASSIAASDISNLSRRATPISAPTPSTPSTPSSISRTSPRPVSTSSSPPRRRCTQSHVRRRSTNEECPICQDGDVMSSIDLSELVWCKSGCGRSVHKTCMEEWIQARRGNNLEPTCTMCRTDWATQCPCDNSAA